MTREEYENAIEVYKKELLEQYDSTDNKARLLRQFKLESFKLNTAFFEYDELSKNFEMENAIPLVKNILELIKEQELTYDQAYATLEQVYNHLKYESNFVKVKR